VVTCESSMDGGPPGRDVATVTVLPPEGGPVDRIWTARIAGPVGNQLIFGDQYDLSARSAESCQARHTDQGPAWSPRGDQLVFVVNDDWSRLCLTAPDGSAGHVLSGDIVPTNRWLADPAWSPDGSQIAVAAQRSESPSSILTVSMTGGAPNVLIRTDGGARQPAYQVVTPGDLSLTVSVGGQPGYLGGTDLTVTYTVRNTSTRPLRNTWLSLALPYQLLPATALDPRCEPGTALCRLGDLDVGDQQRVTVRLAPRAALVGTVAGRVTATGDNQVPVTRFGEAAILVRAPTLRVSPEIGPPGFVTLALGTDFPPGARVRLRWVDGITATPDTVTVDPDGSIRAQVLILRKDRLGPRDLTAERVTGPLFGPVRTTRPFLVTPRTLAPPAFSGRG
jgi:hypothetical protein